MAFFLPEPAFDQHIAILGKTGSGKTWTAKLIVEHALKLKRQVCVLDPTGAWFGLRLGADSKRKGFDVVLLGGEHADIPLAERSGEAVARLVTEQGANVVIDTSGFTVGEYTRWFITFAGTLYTTLRNPLHLVIDEAHYFMPQGRVPDPDAGRMLHAGNRLMSGGRSRGIRGLMITQRPAKLHKDALTCADTLIAMRVIAPQDRQAVKDWIDGCGNAADGKQVLDSLAQLKRGEGWVWYPEGGHLKRETFPPITTYDSSAAPKHDAKAAVHLGEIDLSAVKSALAEAVREAEANDPKLLRKRIADLERQLRERPAATVEVEKIVEVPVLKNGQLDRTEGIIGRLEKVGQAVTTEAAELRRLIAPAVAPKMSIPKETSVRAVSPRKQGVFVTPRPRPSISSLTGESQRLPIGERKTLAALIQYPSGLLRTQLTVLTGYKRSSRDAYIARLREKGYVGTDGERVTASDDGVAALPDYEPLPTGQALQDYWLARLPAGEKAILEVLIQHYPDSVDRDSLEEVTGYKRSSRDAYLSRLAAKELVNDVGRGVVKASDDLFG